MLKHVTNGSGQFMKKYDSVGRVDTISLNSSLDSSSSSDGSITDSGYEPTTSCPSRSSSSSSIHIIDSPKVPIKIHTRVLCTDAEYKTLSIYNHTTCREIVQMILAKFRLKHRDPKLFYLTLEAWIKQTGIPIRSVMTLEDDACPALLQSCYTQKDLKFTLLMRRGGIVKIYDTCFPQGTLYKSLLISERTTAIEAVQLLLNCCNSSESVSKFALYEICPSRNTERLLNVSEPLLAIQADWPNPDFAMFQLRYASEQNKSKLMLTHKVMMPTQLTTPIAPITPPKPVVCHQTPHHHQYGPRHAHIQQTHLQQSSQHSSLHLSVSHHDHNSSTVPSLQSPSSATFNTSAENFRQNFKQQLSLNISMRHQQHQQKQQQQQPQQQSTPILLSRNDADTSLGTKTLPHHHYHSHRHHLIQSSIASSNTNNQASSPALTPKSTSTLKTNRTMFV